MAMNVEIYTDPATNENRANVSGVSTEVISDDSILAFRLHSAALKPAIAKYLQPSDKFLQILAYPTDVFLRSPTPWNDLYSSYNWAQVQQNLIPLSATILESTSSPSILKKSQLENESSSEAWFDSSITQTVSNTVSSSWSQSHKISVGQKITYSFKLGDSASVGGETSFSYDHTWGSEESKSQTVTLGSSDGTRVLLQPNEKRLVELSADRGTLKVRVQYRASLTGLMAVNYKKKYKGHHFYGFKVANVMAANAISNSLQNTQDLTFEYYTNAKIVLKDLKGKTMESFDLGNVLV